MKYKKSFEKFISTIQRTNIRPSYYYTDYRRVAMHLENFKEIINRFTIINSKEDFINQFLSIIKKNPRAIEITPLFSGIRPDKLVVLNEKGDYVEKFNSKTISINKAISFLEEVGFLERINENSPFNLQSYFFGINVGLDSNGRKNRGGKQMQMIVGSYLKATNYEFIEQSKIKDLNKKWNTKFINEVLNKKIFDFIFKKNNSFYLIECNFFNASGSKSDINTRYIKLNENLKNTSPKLHLVLITDGQGLLKAKNEIKYVFDNIEHVYNINYLKNHILKKI